MLPCSRMSLKGADGAGKIDDTCGDTSCEAGLEIWLSDAAGCTVTGVAIWLGVEVVPVVLTFPRAGLSCQEDSSASAQIFLILALFCFEIPFLGAFFFPTELSGRPLCAKWVVLT